MLYQIDNLRTQTLSDGVVRTIYETVIPEEENIVHIASWLSETTQIMVDDAQGNDDEGGPTKTVTVEGEPIDLSSGAKEAEVALAKKGKVRGTARISLV